VRFIGFISVFLVLQGSFCIKEPWFGFEDPETGLIGFKDKNGNVRIDPKFTWPTRGGQFNNIIPVVENIDDKTVSYYLLRNGEKVQHNNLFWDVESGLDCESENSIRYQDNNSHKIGFLRSNGKILIPAIYDRATPFTNGLSLVLKGATWVCNEKTTPCEHWGWEGGEQFIINNKNEVLIEDFKDREYLDWYSLKVVNVKSNNPLYASYKGKNNKFYQFIDIEKEFDIWIRNDFLSNPDPGSFLKNSFSEITYWHNKKGWLQKENGSFVKDNYTLLVSELSLIKEYTIQYSILVKSLNPFIFNSEKYTEFYDTCGKSKIWQNPVLSVIISHYIDKELHQNHFDFIRTKKGYKLLSVSVEKPLIIAD